MSEHKRWQIGSPMFKNGWMWVYDLWMYDMRVPEERRAVWEEDIRPLFKEGE